MNHDIARMLLPELPGKLVGNAVIEHDYEQRMWLTRERSPGATHSHHQKRNVRPEIRFRMTHTKSEIVPK